MASFPDDLLVSYPPSREASESVERRRSALRARERDDSRSDDTVSPVSFFSPDFQRRTKGCDEEEVQIHPFPGEE